MHIHVAIALKYCQKIKMIKFFFLSYSVFQITFLCGKKGRHFLALLESLLPFQASNTNMDEWTTHSFMAHASVFQSYRTDGTVIMKQLVQWNAVNG